MSQAAYLIFLFVTLLAVISTPANASPLEKKWNKECCPVSACVFNKGDVIISTRPNYLGNTFNGILSFTESPKNKLQISGFIDIDGVTVGGVTDGSIGAFSYDLHVADCSSADSAEPSDPAIIDLDDRFFDEPILTNSDDLGISPKSIKDIK